MRNVTCKNGSRKKSCSDNALISKVEVHTYAINLFSWIIQKAKISSSFPGTFTRLTANVLLLGSLQYTE